MANYKIGDIVEMMKPHPCSPKSKTWILVDVGADIKMKCTTCGSFVTMKRFDFDKKLVKVIEEKK